MSQRFDKLFIILCYAFSTSILLVDITPIPLSITMGSLFILPIFFIKLQYIWRNFITNKPMLLLTLCFICLLPSAFYCNDFRYLAQRWQIALPFLLLPLAFANAPKLTKLQWAKLNVWLAIQVFVIALIAIVYYLLNQAEINQRYLESMVMPTLLTHHPTYSLLVAYSIYCLYYIIISKKIMLNKKNAALIWFVVIFLFIFQHIYAVRIGLIALYTLILLEFARLFIIAHKYRYAIIGATILCTAGFFILNYSPTVKNKLKNTRADIDVLKTNKNANHHSMAMRIISYKIAWELFLKQPITGTGLGNIKNELETIYNKQYPEMTKHIIPHNLILFMLSSTGIICTVIFLFGLFYGVIINLKNNPHLLNVHYLLVFLYAMVEAATQTQLGVAYVLFLILAGNNTLKAD